MKAVTWHGVGDIRLEDVPNPTIQDPYDAVVEITTSAICGTDLHFVRGTMPGMREGTVLGHEAVGVVRETGPGADGGDDQMVAKAGTIGTIGVYPPPVESYPFGQAMNKNLTVTGSPPGSARAPAPARRRPPEPR